MKPINLGNSMSKSFIKTLSTGILFGVGMFPVYLILSGFNINWAVVASIFSGLVFGFLMAVFVLILSSSKTSGALFDGDTEFSAKIVAYSNASYMDGKVAIGGKVLISNEIIKFSPHKLNFNNEKNTFDIERKSIGSLELIPQKWNPYGSKLKLTISDSDEFFIFLFEDADKVKNYLEQNR
jgi:hypothetical protein